MEEKSHLKDLGCLMIVTFNQVQCPVGQQEIQRWHKQFYCNQVNVFNQFSSLKGALSSVAQALTLQLIGWDRSSLQSKNTVINFKSTSVLKRRGKKQLKRSQTLWRERCANHRNNQALKRGSYFTLGLNSCLLPTSNTRHILSHQSQIKQSSTSSTTSSLTYAKQIWNTYIIYIKTYYICIKMQMPKGAVQLKALLYALQGNQLLSIKKNQKTQPTIRFELRRNNSKLSFKQWQK